MKPFSKHALRVCLETRSCGILLVLVVLLVLENPCKIEDEDENDDEDERLNRVSKQALRLDQSGRNHDPLIFGNVDL